jgi:energy-coupling factor transporter ATP-binding protein EcfA2
MLTVSQLSKSFAGRALFDDVSLQVNRGDRIGLVGPNGAGKSTLFSLLLGDVSPDKGTIAIEKNATIGFLPQETAAAGDETPQKNHRIGYTGKHCFGAGAGKNRAALCRDSDVLGKPIFKIRHHSTARGGGVESLRGLRSTSLRKGGYGSASTPPLHRDAAVNDHGYSFPLFYINILYGSRARVSGAWSALRLAGRARRPVL